MPAFARGGTARSLVASTLLFFTSSLLSDALAFSPKPADTGREQGHAGVFDDVTLLDQAGGRFTAGRVEGDVVVLNFIFTECGTSCPVQTEALAAVQRALSPAVRAHVSFVSVTVDPANDTVARLKEFADAHHVDQTRWAFVTGTPDQLARLTRRFEAVGANSADAKTGFHTTDVRLIDAHGRVMQRYAGAPLDQARLRREIEALAGAGRG